MTSPCGEVHFAAADRSECCLDRNRPGASGRLAFIGSAGDGAVPPSAIDLAVVGRSGRGVSAVPANARAPAADRKLFLRDRALLL